MEFLYFKSPHVRIQVDFQDVYYGRSGEFSPEADIAFDKHVERLKKLNAMPMYQRMNGERLKALHSSEPFRYWRP